MIRKKGGGEKACVKMRDPKGQKRVSVGSSASYQDPFVKIFLWKMPRAYT